MPKNEAEIFSKVKSILGTQLGVNETNITVQSKLNEDLGADSLDSVELIMALEEEFNIEIPDQDAEKIQTVGDILDYLMKKT